MLQYQLLHFWNEFCHNGCRKLQMLHDSTWADAKSVAAQRETERESETERHVAFLSSHQVENSSKVWPESESEALKSFNSLDPSLSGGNSARS
jgi:hypothetical protein